MTFGSRAATWAAKGRFPPQIPPRQGPFGVSLARSGGESRELPLLGREDMRCYCRHRRTVVAAAQLRADRVDGAQPSGDGSLNVCGGRRRSRHRTELDTAFDIYAITLDRDLAARDRQMVARREACDVAITCVLRLAGQVRQLAGEVTLVEMRGIPAWQEAR